MSSWDHRRGGGRRGAAALDIAHARRDLALQVRAAGRGARAHPRAGLDCADEDARASRGAVQSSTGLVAGSPKCPQGRATVVVARARRRACPPDPDRGMPAVRYHHPAPHSAPQRRAVLGPIRGPHPLAAVSPPARSRLGLRCARRRRPERPRAALHLSRRADPGRRSQVPRQDPRELPANPLSACALPRCLDRLPPPKTSTR